uniref:Glycosyltransferase n=1 Tax=viral metagenome TaxID=1070528 RepID=A0A6C0BSP4_9ZZZZ
MCKYKFHAWHNRTGNHLVALINLIHYAFITKKAFSIEIPSHPFFKLKTNKNLEKDEQKYCKCSNVEDLTRRFNPCGVITLTFDDFEYIFNKYIILNMQNNEQDYYDICIHIRGGDIFNNLVHGMYVQPPLDYYLKIINLNIGSKICIVSEDDSNPVMPYLKKFVQRKKLKNVVFKSSTLINDIMTLSRCRNLIFSFGTFCILPFLLSNTIRTIIIPKSVSVMNWFKTECKNCEVKVIDFSSKYFDRWHNSEREREIMMSYVLEDQNQIDKLLHL